MPNTYDLIASNTVGSGGTASVTFSSIPSTYTDLVLNISIRSTSGTPWINMRFNGASTNYTGRRIEGAGSGTPGGGTNSTSGYMTLGIMGGSGDTASTFSSHTIYIPSYASANYKPVSTEGVTENNATAAYANLTANLWSDTAAITSILLIPEVGSFVQYSNFYLYGIKNS